MAGRMVLMGGMGYPMTETTWGMPTLKNRLEAIGLEVYLTTWSDRQGVYNFMHGYTGWRGYAGDSLGAGSAGQYPGDVHGEVNYAAGFQPSEYDQRSHGGYQTIAPNIVRAHCIYDPVWIDTAGLGYAQWVGTPNAKTILLVTQHRGAHPDDAWYTQDMVYAEIKQLYGGHK